MIEVPRPFFSRWLSLACLLASCWIAALVVVTLALDRSSQSFANLILVLVGVVAFISLGVALLTHLRWVIKKATWWQKGECSSKAWGIVIQVLTGVVAPLLVLDALFWNVMLWIFHDNVQTGNSAQVWVVISSIIAGLGAILAILVCARRNWFGALGLVIALVVCGWSYWCWGQPGVEGLIH